MARRTRNTEWTIEELSKEIKKVHLVGLSYDELAKRLRTTKAHITRAERFNSDQYELETLQRIKEERKGKHAVDEVPLFDREPCDWEEDGGYRHSTLPTSAPGHRITRGPRAHHDKPPGYRSAVDHEACHSEQIQDLLTDPTLVGLGDLTEEELRNASLEYRTRQPEWAYAQWRRLRYWRAALIHQLSKQVILRREHEQYMADVLDELQKIERAMSA